MHRWTALALLLTLAPPIVQAAHVHDHRYMVVGRVIDDQELPAGLLPVRAQLRGTPQFVPAQVVRTSCQGDFVAVFPVSDIGSAHVELTINDDTTRHDVDTLMRRTFVRLQVAGTVAVEECERARRNFTERHVVTGRLLDADLEPRVNATIDITVRLSDGGELAASGETNAAGDFAIGIASSRLDEDAEVFASSGRETWSASLDARYGVTVVDHVERGGDGWAPLLAGSLSLVAAGVLVYVFFRRTKRSD